MNTIHLPTTAGFVVIVLSTLAVGNVAAATLPNAASLVEAMRMAVVPARAQLGQATLVTHGSDHETKVWHMVVARKRLADGPHTVIGITSGDDGERGTALLAAPRDDESGYGLWIYSPTERRVRELTPLEANNYFLDSSLTFADLAMAPSTVKDLRITGEQALDERAAYILEARPGDDSDWQYLRTVTWVDAHTKLPLRREYYDRADRLWRVATYRNSTIDGTPTMLSVSVTDVQTGKDAHWLLDNVRYDRPVDDEMFRPHALAGIVESLVWKDTVAVATPR